MYKCDIKIMATKSRSKNVAKLVEALNLSNEDVVWDDREINATGDAIYTAEKAWKASFNPDTTHRLVLQDDVIVCDNFLSYLQDIVNAHPNSAITLFDNLPFRTYKKGMAPYIEGSFLNGQAIVLPLKYMGDMWDWINNYENYTPKDDIMISKYCSAKGITKLSTSPALVQHIGDTGYRSLIKKELSISPRIRISYNYLQQIPSCVDFTSRNIDLLKDRIFSKVYDTLINDPIGKDYKFDIKVIAIKERKSNVEKLMKDLNLSEEDIIWDNRPEEEKGECYTTAMKAWLSPHQEGITHRVVLADDVVPCNNFRDYIQQIINTHPTKGVGLFNMNKDIDLFTPYISTNLIWGNGILLPLNVAKKAFEWAESVKNTPIFRYVDDEMISEYCDRHEIHLLITTPPLLQHIGDIGDYSSFIKLYGDDYGKKLKLNPRFNNIWKKDQIIKNLDAPCILLPNSVLNSNECKINNFFKENNAQIEAQTNNILKRLNLIKEV